MEVRKELTVSALGLLNRMRLEKNNLAFLTSQIIPLSKKRMSIYREL